MSVDVEHKWPLAYLIPAPLIIAATPLHSLSSQNERGESKGGVIMAPKARRGTLKPFSHFDLRGTAGQTGPAPAVKTQSTGRMCHVLST